MKNENAVLCFCKHPEPGMVKSRLANDIGANEAAKVYRIMLKTTLENVCGHEFDVLLYCYPNSNHPTLQAHATNFSLTLHSQHGKDLGEKMWTAIDSNLSTYKNLVLVGTDCLLIDANYVYKAFEQLNNGSNVVLGPSEDGGYALIGANKIDISIFQDISWSTDNVFQQTLKNLQKLEWKYSCLSIVRDLDDIDDYHYFKSDKRFMHLF